MKIVTAEQMRQVEQECARRGVPAGVLMENAGKAVAEVIAEVLKEPPKRITVLVGPGNNGGDGLVAGRYLHDWGHDVRVYLLASRPAEDRNLVLVRQRGIEVIEVGKDSDIAMLENWFHSADAMIDAVFGTGKSRTISGDYARALGKLDKVRSQRGEMKVFALDLPSGLDADTGAVDPVCPYVDYTITLGFPKRGLFNMPGAGRSGRIKTVDIGIPADLKVDSPIELVNEAWVKALLPTRPLAANKGTFGKVMVVAGSRNYIGAAYLACTGAMRVGAGLVTLAIVENLYTILASKLTEVTYLPLPESGNGALTSEAAGLISRASQVYDVLLVGCGLGRSQGTQELVESLVLSSNRPAPPLVIDADGLNILSEIFKREKGWQRLPEDAILTPHPGEMARLTGLVVGEVQADRAGVAAKMAREWNKTVVLKGAYTVIASPGGRIMISPFANPGLASAGTGDVLAGVIAGLVAQGTPLFEAAVAGVYLHGKAGEMVADRLGEAGMVAGDLLPILPLAIRYVKKAGPALQEELTAAGG